MSKNDITGLIEFLPEELASFFEGASYFQTPEFHSRRRELTLYFALKAPLHTRCTTGWSTRFG